MTKEFILIRRYFKTYHLITYDLELSCVRDSSGNPFVGNLNIYYCINLLPQKIGADSPTEREIECYFFYWIL